MGKRTNTAQWLPNQNRWQIKVQKDGVRYVDIDAFADTFKCSRDVPMVTLPGGTERFARLDDVRHMATGNKALTEWLAVVDSLPK